MLLVARRLSNAHRKLVENGFAHHVEEVASSIPHSDTR
jgi:hypothetical protein